MQKQAYEELRLHSGTAAPSWAFGRTAGRLSLRFGQSVLVLLELAQQLCLSLGLQSLKVVNWGALWLRAGIDDVARDVPLLG